MSLAGFIGGFGQGYLAGRDARSTWDYRQSIINMRNAQAASAQAAGVDAQNSRYTALDGAMARNQVQPGMNVLPGALAYAKANYPPAEYNQIRANALKIWSPDQIKAMDTPAAQPSQGSGTMVGNFVNRLLGRSSVPAPAYMGSGASTSPDAAAELAQDQYMGDMQAAPGASAPMTAPAIPQPNTTPMGPQASAIPMQPLPGATPQTDPGMDQGQLALNSYQQYLAQANAIQQGQAAQQAQQSQQAGQGAGAAAGYAAKGGAIPARGYASGGPTDPDVAAAAAQSNGQPNLPTPGGSGYDAMRNPATAPAMAPAPASAMPPAAPPQGAIPAPSPTASAGLPPPAAPQSVTPTAAMPTSAAPPSVPAGGMPHMHPAGLAPLANPKAPITTVPPQALQASSPAEAALKHAQLAFGLHPGQNPQAQPQQTAANYTELQHGAGAESNQMVQTAREKMFGPGAGDTGPNATPLGLQNASLLNNLYNYDLENHGPAVAAADSFAVLQNYRVNMQMYGGAAAASFESGNLPAAAHYLQQAYAFFPDGNDATVKPGPNGSLVATRTDPNGKVVDTSTFASPDDLNKFIMQSSSFETYNAYVAGAQKAQLDAANTMDQIKDRDADVGLHAASVGNEIRNTGDEINDRDISTSLDAQRTKAELAGGGKDKTPTAQTYATYQADLNTQLQGQLGQNMGFANAPAAMQDKLITGATNLGIQYNLDPATSAQIVGYALSHPDVVKNGSVMIRGKQYQIDTGDTVPGKATGGVISPAARAMADLPSS